MAKHIFSFALWCIIAQCISIGESMRPANKLSNLFELPRRLLFGDSDSKRSRALLGTSLADNLNFPDGFMFGASSSSAYQIEGAWNVSDKSESILDTFYHENPSATLDQSNADDTSEAYDYYLEDIKIAKALGLAHYKFSLSWTRILPDGFPNSISQDGVDYYNKIIDALVAEGIEPMVTLYYWDLPQRLQNLGGWTNPLVTEWFKDYARVCFSLFGDRVKYWNTVSDTVTHCAGGYTLGVSAPGIADKDVAYYLCVKNQIVAHAKAYRVYECEFKDSFNGKIAPVNQYIWYEPESEEFTDLTELIKQYAWGVFTHPIYSDEGGWPAAIEEYIAEKSAAEGYSSSRLPAFTEEEIELVKGTYDYLAVNYYTSRKVRATLDTDTAANTIWPTRGAPEFGATFIEDPNWALTTPVWFSIYPAGLRNVLGWIKEQYGDVEVIITENGYCDDQVGADDPNRPAFIKNHLTEVLKAINEDAVNVIAYTYYAVHDTFEWLEGYVVKYGLYAIDFASPLRTRTARNSASYYAKIIAANSLDVEE